jgi:hypothetical protein
VNARRESERILIINALLLNHDLVKHHFQANNEAENNLISAGMNILFSAPHKLTTDDTRVIKPDANGGQIGGKGITTDQQKKTVIRDPLHCRNGYTGSGRGSGTRGGAIFAVIKWNGLIVGETAKLSVVTDGKTITNSSSSSTDTAATKQNQNQHQSQPQHHLIWSDPQIFFVPAPDTSSSANNAQQVKEDGDGNRKDDTNGNNNGNSNTKDHHDGHSSRGGGGGKRDSGMSDKLWDEIMAAIRGRKRKEGGEKKEGEMEVEKEVEKVSDRLEIEVWDNSRGRERGRERGGGSSDGDDDDDYKASTADRKSAALPRTPPKMLGKVVFEGEEALRFLNKSTPSKMVLTLSEGAGNR